MICPVLDSLASELEKKEVLSGKEVEAKEADSFEICQGIGLP